VSRSNLAVFLAALLVVAACAKTARNSEEEARQDAAAEVPLVATDSRTPPPEALAAEADLRLRRHHESSAKAHMEQGQATNAVAPATMGAAMGDPLGARRYAPFIQDRENYHHFEDGGVLRAAEAPVSTFSVDVDTGAYANVRRFLRSGALPREDAVRVEEMINYFDYAYAPPASRDVPFSVHTEIAPTPWNGRTHLLRIGLQGWRPEGALPPSNLVFLVDVSGSMQSQDKLPLVKSSLKMLARQLGARDRISLVVYAGASGVVLEPTPGDQQARILGAIERLEAGGSTNGGDGIRLAYAMAEQAYVRDGINRVLLATDGDFNVGTVDFEQLKDLVEGKRKTGVALSTLGFGTGNYNDHLMEQLADAGNGNYTYVDGLQEARRALVQSRAATLQTIAKDVKIQVEFNPAAVAEYRLIGYENRALNREDFNNDRVDAGDIGAGHSVTALYEIALAGAGAQRMDPLRYSAERRISADVAELAFLRLRYKAPDGDVSRLIERPIAMGGARHRLADASESFRFAAAVAAFGQVLRGGRYTESFGFDEVLALARAARGADRDGWKGEFIQLVELAQGLQTHAVNTGRCDAESGCG